MLQKPVFSLAEEYTGVSFLFVSVLETGLLSDGCSEGRKQYMCDSYIHHFLIDEC